MPMNDDLSLVRLLVAALAVWRIVHLLSREDGPFDAVARLRSGFGQSWAGRLLDCPYCLSLWVAAPAAFLVCTQSVDRVFVWLALSAASCLLEQTRPQPVIFQSLDLPSERKAPARRGEP
jgi:hypothetical protein